MNWPLSLLIALITGMVGLLVSGFTANACVDWYHISSREGASGFFVIGLALLGGIASGLIGLIIARVVSAGADPSFGKALAVSLGLVLGIGGLVAVACHGLADIPPTLEGEELRLEVEIRLPLDQKTSPKELKGEPRLELGSVVNQTRRASRTGELKVAQARLEDGRWVLPGEVLLFTSRGQRSLDARIGDDVLAGFLVPVPAHPGQEHEQWSDWGPRPPADSPPWPDTQPSYRFRVQRIPPPPPPPTLEEQAAAKDAAEQAIFDAIPSGAPIQEWLPYTPEWQHERRRSAAMERITSREGYAAELGNLMLGEDVRQAEAALRFIGQLPSPDAALVTAVTAAGRDLVLRCKKVNASTVEEDPHYEGAADLSLRFSAWMVAVRALRERNLGDFLPELGEILELSRVRTDSQAMQQDVRRVASYYLKTWVGVEPLPGDPPPR